MAKSGLRERNRARTREEIIVAALELFEDQGYDNTTVDDIAAATDISVRTFYRYFDTKLDVVIARTSDVPEIDDMIGAVIARPASEDPVTALSSTMQVGIEELESRGTVDIRQNMVMLTTPSLNGLWLAHFRELEIDFAAAIATRLGRSSDDIDARLLAAAFMAAIQTGIDRWLAADRPSGMLWPNVKKGLDRLEHHFPELSPG